MNRAHIQNYRSLNMMFEINMVPKVMRPQQKNHPYSYVLASIQASPASLSM